MKNFIINILKGLLLGLSIVLPGISGGTLAFILGIYEKLIEEISAFKSSHLKSAVLCLSFKREHIKNSLQNLKETWDWAFLVPLLMGIFLAVFLFISLAGAWIQNHSLIFYSFILGLILASLIPPFQEMHKSFHTFLAFTFSLVLNLALFTLSTETLHLQASPLLFAPIGFLIAITLIIPGLSGSYLLLMLGLYETTILSFKNLDILMISLFLMGILVGFIVTAKFIKKILIRSWDYSLAIILGLILGSIYSIYPLKKEGLNWSQKHPIFFYWMLLGFFSFLCLYVLFIKKEKTRFKGLIKPWDSR